MPITIVPPPTAPGKSILEMTVDELAAKVEAQPDSDYIAQLFENAFHHDYIAKIFSSAMLSAGKAASVLNSPYLSVGKAALVLSSAHITDDRAVDILVSENLAVDRIAAIFDDANMSGSRAGKALCDPRMPVARTFDILDAMTTIAKLLGNVLWSDDFSTLWTVEEIYDPDNNGSLSLSEDTGAVFRDAPRSMKGEHSDGGGDHESIERAYKQVSIDVSGCSKLLLYFPIYIDDASAPYGNLRIIIGYTDRGGASRSIQYILRKGGTIQDSVSTDITVDLSNIALDSWYVLKRDFLSDTQSYPPAEITEISVRTLEWAWTLRYYLGPLLILGG